MTVRSRRHRSCAVPDTVVYSDRVTQTSDSPSIKWRSRATVLPAGRPGRAVHRDLDRDAVGTWEVSRGSEDKKMILRASFIPDSDAPLQYGGQLADNMQMNLYAIVEKNPEPTPKPEPCRGHCCAYP